MIYTWACKKTGKMIPISRKMKDSDSQPTKKECLDEGWTTSEYEIAKKNGWLKIITGGSGTITFGQKGRW